MHAADECDALAGSRTLRDHCRNIPVLPRGHLYALKIEKVFLARLQIIDIERADDFAAIEAIPLWIVRHVVNLSCAMRGVAGCAMLVLRDLCGATLLNRLDLVPPRSYRRVGNSTRAMSALAQKRK